MSVSFFLRFISGALTLCICNLAAASDWESATKGEFSEIVRFQSGVAYINGGVVVIRNQDGTFRSKSYCENVSYDEIVAFWIAFRDAVQSKHHEAVAEMVGFPLDRKISTVGSRAGLLREYNEIFSKSVRNELFRAEPHDVFCANGLALLNGGDFAARKLSNGKIVVVAVPP